MYIIKKMKNNNNIIFPDTKTVLVEKAPFYVYYRDYNKDEICSFDVLLVRNCSSLRELINGLIPKGGGWGIRREKQKKLLLNNTLNIKDFYIVIDSQFKKDKGYAVRKRNYVKSFNLVE